MLALASVAVLCFTANDVMAQGRRNGGNGGGNFDPAQFRQQQMDRIKEAMEVKDDAEWKVLEGAIGKVMDAQRDVRALQSRGFGRGAGNRRGGNNGGDAAANDQGGQRRNRGGNGGNAGGNGGFGGTPDPDLEALQAAVEAKAPADEIKAKLSKVRESIKAKEAKLTSAQSDLQKLLIGRQEAVALLFGLLK